MPVRSWKLSKNDKDIKKLEETIFLYAKQNLAVVNVYIKVLQELHEELQLALSLFVNSIFLQNKSERIS